jgi:hypothetical protein
MKKIFLLAVLPLIVFPCIFAQDLKFGVYADPQITWLQPEARNVSSDGIGFGFAGGLIMDKYFQKNYAIQTGIGIGSQGGNLTYDNQTMIRVYDDTDTLPAGTTLEYNLNYITVPLGLKLKTNQIGYFSYFARVGFTNQFRIKAKGTSDEGTLNNDVIEKEIGIYNLAYHFGAGVEYGLSEDTAILFGITFHNGFLDVTDRKSEKVSSRVFALRLGVIF